MQPHIASTRCIPSSAMLTPPARLLSHKLSVAKSFQASRLHRCKQLAAVQSSEVLVNRVPASTAQQQVRFCKLLLSACCLHQSLRAPYCNVSETYKVEGPVCSTSYGSVAFGHA